MNRLLTQMLGQMGDFSEAGLDGMKFDAVSMSVLIDKEGTLKTIGMQFAMTMDMTVEGETTSIAYEYDMDCTINALGDDVVITFPDFTGFEELTQPQPEIGDGETVSDETLEGWWRSGPRRPRARPPRLRRLTTKLPLLKSLNSPAGAFETGRWRRPGAAAGNLQKQRACAKRKKGRSRTKCSASPF